MLCLKIITQRPKSQGETTLKQTPDTAKYGWSSQGSPTPYVRPTNNQTRSPVKPPPTNRTPQSNSSCQKEPTAHREPKTPEGASTPKIPHTKHLERRMVTSPKPASRHAQSAMSSFFWWVDVSITPEMRHTPSSTPPTSATSCPLPSTRYHRHPCPTFDRRHTSWARACRFPQTCSSGCVERFGSMGGWDRRFDYFRDWQQN